MANRADEGNTKSGLQARAQQKARDEFMKTPEGRQLLGESELAKRKQQEEQAAYQFWMDDNFGFTKATTDPVTGVKTNHIGGGDGTWDIIHAMTFAIGAGAIYAAASGGGSALAATGGEVASAAGEVAAGTLPVNGAALGDLGWMSGINSGAATGAAGAGAGAGAAAAGVGAAAGGGGAGAGLGSMIGVEGLAPAVVNVGAPAAAAGGGAGAGLGAVGAGVGGLGAIANGGGGAGTGQPSLNVPNEFIDNAEQAYNDQSQHVPNIKPNDFSTGNTPGKSLVDNVKNLNDIVKPISSVIGAVNDKNNSQNTANNANGQLQALLDAQKTSQAQQTAYLDKLNTAASTATANNATYAKDLKGLYDQNTAANASTTTKYNDLYTQTGTNNAGYIKDMQGLNSSIISGGNSTASMLRAAADKQSKSATGYVSTMDKMAKDSIASNAEYTKRLSSMYAPGTPEHEYMRQQMEAKDAATGRRSQYGTRAVDLAAQMSPLIANIMTSSAYTNAMDNKNAQGIYQHGSYQDAMYDKIAVATRERAAAAKAAAQSASASLLGSSGYTNALNNKGQLDILNSAGYQNASTNASGTNILTGTAYQNAINNTGGNAILTSPAMSNTVNNSSLLNLLGSNAYIGLNNQATTAQNQQNYGGLNALGQLFSGNNLSNAIGAGQSLYNGLSSLF